MRNIQDAIRNYEKTMESRIYIDDKKTKCIDYSKLKKLNKETLTNVLDEFKQKAFGDINAESILKIENDIQEKYKYIKQKLIKQYEKEINAFIKPLSDQIENKIRMNQFKKPQDLIDEINVMKTEFKEQTKQLGFKNKELIMEKETTRIM